MANSNCLAACPSKVTLSIIPKRAETPSNKRPTLEVKGLLIFFSSIVVKIFNSWEENELIILRFCGTFSTFPNNWCSKAKVILFGWDIALLPPNKGNGKKLAILWILSSVI